MKLIECSNGRKQVFYNNVLMQYERILRNNWYELNVATVNRLGYPAIPPLTDKPDDLLNEYISVKVNIQPWVKKGKEIVLQ